MNEHKGHNNIMKPNIGSKTVIKISYNKFRLLKERTTVKGRL